MSEAEHSAESGPKQGNRLRALEAKAAARRRISVAALCLLACALAGVAYGWWLLQPPSATHRATKADVTAADPGADLERAGLVRSGVAFGLYARWRGEADKIRAGRYTLSPNMTPAQIIRQLRLGPGHSPDDIIRVSVPEGFTVKKVAARLERLGVTDGAVFLQMALNPNVHGTWSYDFPRPPGSLEGYLYPDTYEFLPNTPPEKVLDAMLLNFSKRFYRPYRQQLAARGRSLHEIVTIASMIEREAKTQEDRPRIAGVLENRIKRRMKLEIDATVLYALGRDKQRVYLKDLQVDSPYNTYRRTGLPPGAIASPGDSSLRAALEPEKNDYLYYVARGNGSHYFTRSRQEHEAAVKLARSERSTSGGPVVTPAGEVHEPTR
ncbi:MAG TPA: endolytic transglycosylase MltG [Chthonomonadaceae bacterium]|nr:endolytic transglycosylase MltG [Chthonomonadaceae bacterium]